MTTRLRLSASSFLILFLWGAAPAEVTDSSAIGFTVKNTVEIASPPANVYSRVVHDVGRWWDPAHTFSGDANNLSIEGTANGCFCEKLNDGGSVRHMTVIYAMPGVILRMSGEPSALSSRWRDRDDDVVDERIGQPERNSK